MLAPALLLQPAWDESAAPAVQHVEDLKDDELKHDAAEREGEGEGELHRRLPHFVVPEELGHEEHPAKDEKDELRG